MSDVDDKFAPIHRDELTDDALAYGHVRALKQQLVGMEESMREIARAQTRIADAQLEILKQLADRHDHDNQVDARLADHESRIAALEKPKRRRPRKK